MLFVMARQDNIIIWSTFWLWLLFASCSTGITHTIRNEVLDSSNVANTKGSFNSKTNQIDKFSSKAGQKNDGSYESLPVVGAVPTVPVKSCYSTAAAAATNSQTVTRNDDFGFYGVPPAPIPVTFRNTSDTIHIEAPEPLPSYYESLLKSFYDYPAADPETRIEPPINNSTNCTGGFNTLVADLGLISIIISVASLAFGIISLAISNFYNVYGSALSLLFVGLPSLMTNVLGLLGVDKDSSSPFVHFMTYSSILDSVNNLVSIVPGSLFSDLLGLVSLVLSKIGLVMGIVSSYPIILQRFLEHWRWKEFIDTSYGCSMYTIGKVVMDLVMNYVNKYFGDSTGTATTFDGNNGAYGYNTYYARD